MKKKKLLLLGLAAVATISLASCDDKPAASSTATTGGDAATTTGGAAATTTGGAATTTGGAATTTTQPAVNLGNVDIYLNYSGKSGVSYVSSTPYVNPFDNVSYTKGTLLPVWVQLSKNLNLNVREATTYGVTADADTYKNLTGTNFDSEVNPGQKVDLFYNTTANINSLGSSEQAVDLKQYIEAGKMPNLAAYLEENPFVEDEITYTDGGIYYTPYLDGYNAVERQIIMDTGVVKKLLDQEVGAGLGQLAAGKNGVEKGLKTEGLYQPFIHATLNYAEDQTFQILKNGEVATITAKGGVKNIIVQQNELLAQGTTGGALLSQFKTYLTEVYGTQLAKLSDIFVSESACYNTDELIALMRVFKANPDVIYGDATKYDEVQGVFPRGQNAGRVNNILGWGGCLFGIQGLGGESGRLYYTQDGKLNSAETTTAAYQALDIMSNLYNEGLILKGFYETADKDGNAYVNRYFKKSVDGLSSYGLMMYDFAATQSTPNDKLNGLGTDPASRKTSSTGFDFAGTSVTGVMPVIAPITYWATEEGWDVTSDLGSTEDRQYKTLTRYYEENRALKTNSWCIPTVSDNKDAAVAIMDYMFSAEGEVLQNFGTETYWEMGTVFGEANPVVKPAVIQEFSRVGGDIWDFFRQKIGSTLPVGHERPMTIDYQATHDYAKVGYDNVTIAINKGVLNLAKCDAEDYWKASVRTSCYPKIDANIAKEFEMITNFWSATKLATTADGWVAVVTSADGLDSSGTVTTVGTTAYTMQQVYDAFDAYNTKSLYDYAYSIDGKGDFVPEYAVPDQA